MKNENSGQLMTQLSILTGAEQKATRTVSIRLPESLIAALKILANKKDIPYQSLMKMYLSEKVKEETSADVHSSSNQNA